MTPSTETNPLMSRGFAPFRRELDIEAARVEGSLPDGLQGTLYRIGPNPRFDPLPPYNPFLGDGMIHAFRFESGGVSYRNRWVRTQQWRHEDQAGRALFSTTGDPRRHDPSVSGIKTNGTANTHIVTHSGRLMALEEGHPPITIDPVTLETGPIWNFDGALPANMTAHPKFDPVSGEMIFFANGAGTRLAREISWYVAGSNGAIKRQGMIETPFLSLVHDFAVTRRYLLFLICPLTISIERAQSGGPPLAWEPDKDVHIAVVPRDGQGPVSWLRTSAAFVWHTLNAWDRDNQIVMDLCVQRAPAFPRADGTMSDAADHRQFYHRWLIELQDQTLRQRPMSDLICEYPRFDERFAMQPSRHAWFACEGGPGTDDLFHRGICHFDGTRMNVYRFGETIAVSEPVFVPTSSNADESDGSLLCLAYDESCDHSHLAIFDACDIAAGPTARVMLEHRVPMGFHGTWLDAAVPMEPLQ